MTVNDQDPYSVHHTDQDPEETAEWRESLDALVATHGHARGREIMLSLLKHSKDLHLGVPMVPTTDYINTIAPENEPEFPGNGYEDIVRVAEIKTGAGRLARIRREAGAGAAEVVRVHDYFKPRAEEVAAVLPRRLGAWLERHAAARPAAAKGGGVRLEATSIGGALALRVAAALRPLRPRSLRFAREQDAIERWLTLLENALSGGAGADALALARLPRELKGYGDTHAAGRARFERGVAGATAGNEAARPVIWLARR